MRISSLTPALFVALLATPATAFAAEAPSGGLLSINPGLMFWTLVIFIVLLTILSKYAIGPIVSAVEAREKALEAAILAAKRDRDESAAILADHRTQLEGARAEAQRMIAEGRAAGEKLRAEMLEETRLQQQELLDRARREIEKERDRAIAELRREAVELAIAGATKVLERNMDQDSNRRLVESFLTSLDAPAAR